VTSGALTHYEHLTFTSDTACVKKLLSLGTTTVVYYASIHLESTKKLVDICLTLGQRALVGKVRLAACLPPTCPRVNGLGRVFLSSPSAT